MYEEVISRHILVSSEATRCAQEACACVSVWVRGWGTSMVANKPLWVGWLDICAGVCQKHRTCGHEKYALGLMGANACMRAVGEGRRGTARRTALHRTCACVCIVDVWGYMWEQMQQMKCVWEREGACVEMRTYAGTEWACTWAVQLDITHAAHERGSECVCVLACDNV
jgi:hypothetical protein